MKISGIYQIVNTITSDFYIGSSNDLEKRKKEHFYESTWKNKPNKQLYKDMKQYGKNNFLFKPIWLCDPEELKKYEQIAIEKYNPKYNRYAACTGITGLSKKEYIKQYKKHYNKEHADSIRQQKKQYRKEHADSIKQRQKQYYKQQCLYENELLTLAALKSRFVKKGIDHPTQEAKKYLIGE